MKYYATRKQNKMRMYCMLIDNYSVWFSSDQADLGGNLYCVHGGSSWEHDFNILLFVFCEERWFLLRFWFFILCWRVKFLVCWVEYPHIPRCINLSLFFYFLFFELLKQMILIEALKGWGNKGRSRNICRSVWVL